MHEADGGRLLRLLPEPGERVELAGLYLSEPHGPPRRPSKSFVYANFISSLDGRISLPDRRTAKRNVPRAIANPRDWRLFQELAACADALIVSGQYLRHLPSGVSTRSFPVSTRPEHADLLQWRRSHGLAAEPAVVIVTASVDLPPLDALSASGRSVYVATGEAADPRRTGAVEAQGARVLRVGDGRRVEGGRLIEALAREEHRNIAMIGGGEVLQTLIADDALDRLYLTLACRMVGGLSFDSLLTGPVLEPAKPFRLTALHYDDGAAAAGRSGVEQLFAILDRGLPGASS